MSSRRSLIDRLMRLASPRPVSGFAPPPRELAPGVWLVDRRLRMPGGPLLPLRTTVIRLRDGSLVVISPPPLPPAAELGPSAPEALGPKPSGTPDQRQELAIDGGYAA